MYMRRYFYILLTLACLASCAEILPSGKEDGMGMVCMRMSVDVATRSDAGGGSILETAHVNIYKADFSGLVRTYPYVEMPDVIHLAADAYRVDVIAGEATSSDPAVASWDSKSYKGSALFEVKPGLLTDVEVVAGVTNAVSQVTFDPTVAANFDDGYTFTIGLAGADGAELVYDASNSGAEGYFIIAGIDEPSFEWKFEGILTKKGSEFVKNGTVNGLQPGKLYKMNVVYTIKEGDFNFSIHVDPVIDEIDNIVVFEPVSTGLAESSEYEIWACHATIHADIDAGDSEGASVRFEYSEDGQIWESVDGEQDTEATWKAELKGLTPSTEYTYRLMIDDEQIGEPLSFTTASAPKIPNGGFEYVSKVSGESYYKFYDPNCGVADGSYMFWGSGNGEGPEGVNGSANMGIVITTVDTGTKVEGKQSVCAQSSQMMGILAAGNLFTGQFMGLVGTEGGIVDFGRPWTSRPSALKLYCKYTTGKMDIVKGQPSGVSLTKDKDYDRAQIQFAIGTWNNKTYGGTVSSPVRVNTTKTNTFINYYTDPSTIANGDLVIHNDGYIINKGEKKSASTSEWIEYTIPLIYRNLNEYPTHIVISCAASQYGDYFTGCSSSKLWIDAVELIYE